MTKKRRILGKKGYTLVEIMVVITIMTILAAAGTGIYKGYVEKAKAAVMYDTARQIKEALLICELEYMAKEDMDASAYWSDAFLKAPNHPDSILYPYVGESIKECNGYTLKLGKDKNGQYRITGFSYESEGYTVIWTREDDITVEKIE